MLNKQPDSGGTLILTIQADGTVRSAGPTHRSLGYRISGTDDGVWSQWSWDGIELQVRNDRFGFLPIYYAPIGQGIGISTSALELLAAGADPALDDGAVAVFMRLGYYLGNDTPFRAIRLLAPGSVLSWTAAGLRIESHARPLPHDMSTLSRERAIEEYGVRFQQAVEEMLPGGDERMVVPLSAGRDSRHILYALMRSGRRPDIVATVQAIPPRPDTDVQTASAITAALGLTHEIIQRSENRFEDELQKDILTCFCADEHAQMMPLVHWMQRQKATVSWDGIAGDIFSCGVYNDSELLGRFRRKEFNSLSEWLLNTEGYLPAMLSPEHLERWNRSAAIQRLSAELEQYAELPNPVAPFFFFNRVRRELALCPFGMLNQSAMVLAPYLRHEIFDLLINLPFEYFRGREFHSEAIDLFYQEFPRFEYVSTPVGFVTEQRRRIWRFTQRLAQLVTQQSAGASCIEQKFLLPRLAKAMLHRRYGTEVPVLFSRALVMLHLQNSLQESHPGFRI